jgi:hypothetical protein
VDLAVVVVLVLSLALVDLAVVVVIILDLLVLLEVPLQVGQVE